ncbi:MAG TPA: hypothetical protein VFL95_04740 [Gemmatimonadales bacterium]|nr:hypothetical protein [Gemmatimonadales bacterium]
MSRLSNHWCCRALPALVCAFALAGCSDNPMACSDIFRSLTMTIQNSGGDPVSDATLTLQLPSSDSVIHVTNQRLDILTAGTYVVFSDGYINLLPARGGTATLHVTSSAGDTTLTGFISRDACHVLSSTFPDTLVMAPAGDP